MRVFFLFFLILFSVYGADFITKKEYAKMLYSNPRGIGCDKCHGANAQGSVISKFKQKSKDSEKFVDAELRAPAINNVSYEVFERALEEPKGMMPSYFLTEEESLILYEYITNLKEESKKTKSKGKKK
ncbi:cytochrome C oxidase subunit III [Campylobacter sp. RM9344]|uniref:Cytochrome C oxidase subunit III n=1 Tax=Campylobacter californiensis TaxID=1032243 RepID=A0AAW3ZYL3_9BACT|nr:MULTISPECIES: c-type cytochrome [unclassified Campylobacter]MBE2984831.1 cytochrome C oxidase subunit III [Campylobacter sp. RM6883]MBE2986535.1 cytochrome C oxidase subunit III [Campylobacter sp. RM12919]MBE2987735.1 cytochrome C oxidase subunit III [Campylobacter sp. RM12920]MBE2994703.1 cytochrome C oxidase subunit III [Campylobacter sp. RM6913]MBE3029569.1 cytochrome C oxidase subunit III [Campylobacter sp. RM9344]